MLKYNIMNFMELSTYREVISCTATQELPSISWNPKVLYHIYKGHPLVPYPERDKFFTFAQIMFMFGFVLEN
jgi:hypothetical protein